jgi:molybdate/tungstate transport system ATP-binding protein
LIDAKIRAHVGSFKVSADIESSGVTCIAGRNGAGKTTLMKALAGFIRLDEGHLSVGGVEVGRLPVEKRGIVLVTPSACFHHFDVRSHIIWGARIRGLSPSEDEVSKMRRDLGIDFEGPVRNLSLGMRERVSLATALLARPRAVLVDEVFSSLHDREEFVKTYGSLAGASGVELVFTSQDEADGRMADKLYVLKEGTASLASVL